MLDLILGVNLTAYFEVVIAVHALAVAIVNLTPTPKDDAVVAKAYRVIEFAAGILNRRLVKQ